MTLNLARLGSRPLLVALPVGANAETADLPPLPERNPAQDSRPGSPPSPCCRAISRPWPWTEAEIADAAAKCKKLLTGDPLDYDLAAADQGRYVRDAGAGPAARRRPRSESDNQSAGDAQLPDGRRLGRMAARYGAARSQGGCSEAPVVKIQNSSSYVCRNRYDGAGTPLSEHALANAFDVSEFVLANGVRITVLDHWPRVVTTPPAPKQNPVRVGDGAASAPLPNPRAAIAMASSPRRRPSRASRRRTIPTHSTRIARRAAAGCGSGRTIPTHSTTTRLSPLQPSLRAAIASAVDAAKAEPDEPQPVTAEPAPDSKSRIRHLFARGRLPPFRHGARSERQ